MVIQKTTLRSFLKRDYNRTIRFTQLSILTNVLMALGKLALGLYTRSFFVGVHGLYNLGIGLAKLIAVKGHYDCKKMKDDASESVYYFWIGLVIFISSLLYMVYCVGMIVRARSVTYYSTYMGIAIATVTFTEIGLSVYGIVMARRDRELVMEAIKLTNFVTSIISLVLTQTAILSITNVQESARYTGMTGLVIGSISATTGLVMLYSKRRGRL